MREVKSVLNEDDPAEAYADWTLAEVRSIKGPLRERDKTFYRPKVLTHSALERVMSLHGPAVQYERTTVLPQCRACRQTWPCDVAHLVRTLLQTLYAR